MYIQNLATINFPDRNLPNYHICAFSADVQTAQIRIKSMMHIGSNIHQAHLEKVLNEITSSNLLLPMIQEQNNIFIGKHYQITLWTERMKNLNALFQIVTGVDQPNWDWIVFDRNGMPVGFRDDTSESYFTLCYLGDDQNLNEILHKGTLEDNICHLISYEGLDIPNDNGTYGWREYPISESEFYASHGLIAVDIHNHTNVLLPPDHVPILQFFATDQAILQIISSEWYRNTENYHIIIGLTPDHSAYPRVKSPCVAELNKYIFQNEKITTNYSLLNDSKLIAHYTISSERMNLKDAESILNALTEMEINKLLCTSYKTSTQNLDTLASNTEYQLD
jgi:hypothetical protein